MRKRLQHRAARLLTALLLSCVSFVIASCNGSNGGPRGLTMAVNSGVEGDALKQAARDYESLSGVHINIAEFPYDNLFEKELIDLTAATGAYDLIMLDDPWFPRFATERVLTDLSPQEYGNSGHPGKCFLK